MTGRDDAILAAKDFGSGVATPLHLLFGTV